MVDPESRHHLFDRAMRRAEWGVEQLWLGTIAAGGTISVLDLDAYLYGLTSLPPAQQDVLASALNERLADLYQSAKVPYLITAGPPDPPAEDPLAVLAEHLRAARRAAITTRHSEQPASRHLLDLARRQVSDDVG